MLSAQCGVVNSESAQSCNYSNKESLEHILTEIYFSNGVIWTHRGDVIWGAGGAMVPPAILCGTSGLWDIFIHHSYCFGFTNFYKCLFLLQLEDVLKTWMYNLYIKVFGTYSFLHETNRSQWYLHWFHEFSLDVSSLIVKKKSSKMRHLKNSWNQWR